MQPSEQGEWQERQMVADHLRGHGKDLDFILQAWEAIKGTIEKTTSCCLQPFSPSFQSWNP